MATYIVLRDGPGLERPLTIGHFATVDDANIALVSARAGMGPAVENWDAGCLPDGRLWFNRDERAHGGGLYQLSILKRQVHRQPGQPRPRPPRRLVVTRSGASRQDVIDALVADEDAMNRVLNRLDFSEWDFRQEILEQVSSKEGGIEALLDRLPWDDREFQRSTIDQIVLEDSGIEELFGCLPVDTPEFKAYTMDKVLQEGKAELLMDILPMKDTRFQSLVMEKIFTSADGPKELLNRLFVESSDFQKFATRKLVGTDEGSHNLVDRLPLKEPEFQVQVFEKLMEDCENRNMLLEALVADEHFKQRSLSIALGNESMRWALSNILLCSMDGDDRARFTESLRKASVSAAFEDEAMRSELAASLLGSLGPEERELLTERLRPELCDRLAKDASN
ncbi:hypothetical protein F4780DRAFT_404257 [Xylariomycetidae sp. FL0641]|nr:hypothetical protein F4780DRAFT_404257 [Xylariomycetidae sp. FL0641]